MYQLPEKQLKEVKTRERAMQTSFPHLNAFHRQAPYKQNNQDRKTFYRKREKQI